MAGSYQRNKVKAEYNPMVMLRIFLPRSLHSMLRAKSDKFGIPMSKLAGYAIDNEFECADPFTYLCELPTNQFVQYAYAEEASQIAKYLLKFTQGTGRDTIMLSRRDIGIASKEQLMLGFRELLETQVVVEVKPSKKVRFGYGDDYKYVKIRSIKTDDMLKRKKRDLAKLMAEIDELE